MSLKITVLGTGTSTGVPIPCCSCAVCTSPHARNQRLRASIYLESTCLTSNTTIGILIDTTPDLRYQALRANIKQIDAVLITHTHADHIFGMDDLRGFNFSQRQGIPVLASPTSSASLRNTFSYCFSNDPSYQGGAPPSLCLQTILPYTPFSLAHLQCLPLPVWHGNMEVFGYRFGDFAYITDCSAVPEQSEQMLDGVKTLILDGLRFRPHPTHFSLSDAIAFSAKLNVEKTYLTHLSHEVEYEEGNAFLRKNARHEIALAYDGLVLEVD